MTTTPTHAGLSQRGERNAAFATGSYARCANGFTANCGRFKVGADEKLHVASPRMISALE